MGRNSKQFRKEKQKLSVSEWRQCIHCRVIIYKNDEQIHLNECNTAKLTNSENSPSCSLPNAATECSSSPGRNAKLSHSYVDNGILHAKVCDPAIKDFDWNCVPKIRNLLLIHPSTMRLCQIISNGYVSVTDRGYKTTYLAWPCNYLDKRFVAFRQSETYNHFNPGMAVAIQPISSPAREAEEVQLEPTEMNKAGYLYSEEFSNLLSYQLWSQLLAIGMVVSIQYSESPIELRVAQILPTADEPMLLNIDESSLLERDNSLVKVNKSAEESEIFDDSICNSSSDASFDLSNTDLARSALLSSTPVASVKSSLANLSPKKHFVSFDCDKTTESMLDVFPVEYFKVTSVTILKVTEDDPESPLQKTTFSDIGGLDEQVNIIKERLHQLFYPKTIRKKGSKMCEGILLHGPSGTGKTLIARSIEEELKLPFITVSSNEIIISHYGSEDVEVQKKFEEAIKRSPSIIFLDALDSLCCWKKDTSNKRGKRVLSTLLSIFTKLSKNLESPILVIAKCHDLSAIHPSLRAYGSFSMEVEFKIPDASARRKIFETLIKNEAHCLTNDHITDIVNMTHAYTGSDLAVLCCRARQSVISRYINNETGDAKEISKMSEISFSDMKHALKDMKPFSMLDQEVKIDKVSWDDICGMYDVKKRLQQAVEWPLKFPEIFSRYNLNPTSGILMHGPPGCSKTMLAKALASESGLNFIPVKGPELFTKFYGESERAVRELFARARASKPCIIFLDEVDALLATRDSSSDGSGVERRVVGQFLSEFGGIFSCDGVIVIAATNRPDILDEAVLRPGRIGSLVEVPLPDAETRKEILQKKLQEMPISDDLNYELLVEETKGFSGAKVVAVCKEVAWLLLEEESETRKLTMSLVLKAIKDIQRPDSSSCLDNYD